MDRRMALEGAGAQRVASNALWIALWIVVLAACNASGETTDDLNGIGSSLAGAGAGSGGGASGSGTAGSQPASSGGAVGTAGVIGASGARASTTNGAGNGMAGRNGAAGRSMNGGSGMNGSGGTSGMSAIAGRGGASGSAAGAGGKGGPAQGGTGGTLQCSGPALSGGTSHCNSNMSGTVGSYGWSIWSSGNGGCITPYGVGAAFKATWSNSGDFLAREGFQWDETKSYDQYGTISADYAFTKTGSGGGYSYIGIYGWSNNPLIEFYIVDDWFGSGSPPTAGGSYKDSFTVDGATYKIYTHTQNNQPSIHGTQTFQQFFSIRQTPRQCGHISITEHFKKWASLNMNLGKMYEAKLLVEAGGGSGSIDFTSASMTAQ